MYVFRRFTFYSLLIKRRFVKIRVVIPHYSENRLRYRLKHLGKLIRRKHSYKSFFSSRKKLGSILKSTVVCWLNNLSKYDFELIVGVNSTNKSSAYIQDLVRFDSRIKIDPICNDSEGRILMAMLMQKYAKGCEWLIFSEDDQFTYDTMFFEKVSDFHNVSTGGCLIPVRFEYPFTFKNDVAINNLKVITSSGYSYDILPQLPIISEENGLRKIFHYHRKIDLETCQLSKFDTLGKERSFLSLTDKRSFSPVWMVNSEVFDRIRHEAEDHIEGDTSRVLEWGGFLPSKIGLKVYVPKLPENEGYLESRHMEPVIIRKSSLSRTK